MNRLIICFLSFFIFSLTANSQTPPKRELRSAWLSTFLNLDWPSTATRTVQEVKDSVIKMLDLQQQSGINAIYFQVRNECDAVYRSSIEPWSASVTGTQGIAPAAGFDPLQFMIDECRKRGIEIHAWFNPYRAVNNYNSIGSYAASHVANQHPNWLLAQGSLRILNPGIPEVRDYVLSVVMDVLRRYDVDGIHYDDYFYPYPGAGGTSSRFNDDATFASYPRGFSNKNDWRRDNINIFIQRSYDSIKAIKPWVKFGVSPFGIWQNQRSDAAGSATTGLQSYSDVYADTKKWLQQGWVDYVTPQIYWSTGFNTASYSVLVPWWNNNAYGRHVYVGHALYKLNADADRDPNWYNASQINKQIRLNRTYSNIHGSTFFRSQYFSSNPLKFRDSLTEYLYATPALLPTMPWRDSEAPQPVKTITATIRNNHVQLNWSTAAATTNELNRVRQFVVYRFNSAAINLNDADAIQLITANAETTTYTDSNLIPAEYYYVVTALDRFHNESEPGNVVKASFIPITQVTVTPTEPVANPVVVKPEPVTKPVAEKPIQPSQPATPEFVLQAEPNPATSFTIISYTLPKRMQVTLSVLDNNGKELLKLVDAFQSTGKQLIRFNTSTLTAGKYQVKISAEKIEKIIQVVVTK
ncbi:family 10 glycosylhydrolase [Lacibacter sediminis]|uniref:Family 10 glycosylhydrolase n=1 Tax=Lacibacter sediminis TaxID=2760713 RepID=A0A7G5XKR4_9BACT|nr:family 10 glycosylhydrolase [Lacibacter sediminis]QNA46067.1 family 10 glycosylhydrolase [Lacibacter sediminis]